MRLSLFALLVFTAPSINAAEKLDFAGLRAVAPLPLASAAPLDFSCLDELCVAHATKPALKQLAANKPAKKPAPKSTPKPAVKYRWEVRCQNGQCYRVAVPVVQ